MPNDTASSSKPDPDLRGKTVWAIDTFSRVYQLFHALPEMASPDGTPVSAVFGFARDLLDIIEKKKPDYLVCAIDTPGPTFRHEKFADYKATRAEMPADLVPQIPLIKRLLEVMGIPCLESSGFEADDLLATLAVRTVAAGGDCVIATSDKDARQLLGDHVRLLNLRNNVLFGVLAFGEGWHNNHHAFPASARHGLAWWQFDSSYLIIRTFEKLGLASNINTPRQLQTPQAFSIMSFRLRWAENILLADLYTVLSNFNFEFKININNE
jgi:hypothetical protein